MEGAKGTILLHIVGHLCRRTLPRRHFRNYIVHRARESSAWALLRCPCNLEALKVCNIYIHLLKYLDPGSPWTELDKSANQGHMEVALATGLLRIGIQIVESTLGLTYSKHTAWQCNQIILNQRQNQRNSKTSKNSSSQHWGRSAAGRERHPNARYHNFPPRNV